MSGTGSRSIYTGRQTVPGAVPSCMIERIPLSATQSQQTDKMKTQID
jgi:hypothetical protein